jgi:hypothetical protein
MSKHWELDTAQPVAIGRDSTACQRQGGQESELQAALRLRSDWGIITETNALLRDRCIETLAPLLDGGQHLPHWLELRRRIADLRAQHQQLEDEYAQLRQARHEASEARRSGAELRLAREMDALRERLAVSQDAIAEAEASAGDASSSAFDEVDAAAARFKASVIASARQRLAAAFAKLPPDALAEIVQAAAEITMASSSSYLRQWLAAAGGLVEPAVPKPAPERPPTPPWRYIWNNLGAKWLTHGSDDDEPKPPPRETAYDRLAKREAAALGISSVP